MAYILFFLFLVAAPLLAGLVRKWSVTWLSLLFALTQYVCVLGIICFVIFITYSSIY